MTEPMDSFIERLAHRKWRGKWEIRPNGAIRYLRPRSHDQCPLTALVNISASGTGRASRRLKLEQQSQRIIAAADTRTDDPLRQRMLEALGLTDVR